MEEKKTPEMPAELRDEELDAASGGGLGELDDEILSWVCPNCGAVIKGQKVIFTISKANHIKECAKSS